MKNHQKKNCAITAASARSLAVALTLLTAGVLSSPAAWSHGGEDHGDGATVMPAGSLLAPRAESRSDDMEMLAVYRDKVLTVYLSDSGTNAPISDAQVEIENGSDTVLAKPAGIGMYRADAPWMVTPGKHALVVTVQGEQIADLLETTLEVAPDAEPVYAATSAGLSPLAIAGSLGGVAAFGLAAFGLLRRKK